MRDLLNLSSNYSDFLAANSSVLPILIIQKTLIVLLNSCLVAEKREEKKMKEIIKFLKFYVLLFQFSGGFGFLRLYNCERKL